MLTLAYRELLIMFKIKSRILGIIINPLLWLVAMGFGLSPVLSIDGLSYFTFLVPGMIGVNLLFPSFFGGSTFIMERQFGFLKELLVAPISRSTIILGKALGLSFYATISGIIVLVIGIILGFRMTDWLIGIPSAVAIMILAALGLSCLGLAVASRFRDTQSFQLIGNFIVFPFFLLSGALYPLDKAPWFIQAISYINPITYAIDAMRSLMLGTGHLPLYLSLGVIIAFDIAMVILATWSFEKSE